MLRRLRRRSVVAKSESMQARVKALMAHEFGVWTLFHNPSARHDHDPVRMLDGGDAVRHDQGGATRHQALQCFLHQALGFVVQRRGGFIQNEDRRVLVERTRNRQALALSAGKLCGVVSHQSVHPQRQAGDVPG